MMMMMAFFTEKHFKSKGHSIIFSPCLLNLLILFKFISTIFHNQLKKQ